MPFGQLVIGPPGSGKSTYCAGTLQFMSAIGRKCSVVNLDPANDRLPYPCALDIRDLVSLDDVMDGEEQLGPNGGVVFALEVLAENIAWLRQGLAQLGDDYLLFDCPGQVELFTHHTSLRRVFARLEKWNYRMVVVHLVDAHYCTDPAKYISVLLISLRSMLQIELPHVNVLSKIDIVSGYGKLDFNLDFYTDVQDLDYLIPLLERDPRMRKYAALNRAVCDLVTDFGLVAFETCAVEDKKSMAKLLQVIDRAGGYVFGPAEGAGDNIWQLAVRGGWAEDQTVLDVQERWIDHKDEFDQAERDEWKQRQGQQQDETRNQDEEDGEENL